MKTYTVEPASALELSNNLDQIMLEEFPLSVRIKSRTINSLISFSNADELKRYLDGLQAAMVLNTK